MNIGKFSVERPVAVTMRIASLVLLGAICLTRIPVDLLPKVTIPTIAVNTSWPNVAPQEIETQITRPMEQAVSTTPNLYQVSSSSTMGNSSVRIQLNWGTDIGQAAVDVLQLAQRARGRLPNDPNIGQSLVFKFDPSTAPILMYGVSGESDVVKLRTLLENEISPVLQSANGVASVTVTGGMTRSIMIDVDPQKLQAYGIPMNTVGKRIIEENINLPAGIAKQGETEYTIRSVGTLVTPQEAASIPLGIYNGQQVTLGMVATVRDSHQETRINTRLNGEPAVGITVTKQSDANTVSTADSFREKLEQIKKRYPNLKFNVAYDQSSFITHSIDDLRDTALIGGALAVVILMFFLRSFRSTLVVALSIPISIISTFSLLYFCGYTLNNISLSGLALASGLIVDDAVVVLENIFRHIERDKRSPADASVTGTQEIVSAVLASTFTVMIVFIPLLLIKGQSGQTFTQFAMVVIFSIAVSLLDATTVVPMLASRLIKAEEVEEEAHPELHAAHGKKATLSWRMFTWFGRKFTALDESYHHGLKWALSHRWMTLGLAAGVTALSLLLVPLIGSEMMPQTDSGDFSVGVKHPVGTAFSVTDKTMRQVEKILIDHPDVETVFAAAGANLGFRGASNTAISYQGGAVVHLKENKKKSTADVIKDVQKKFSTIPGVRIMATPYDQVTQVLTGGATNMEVDVFGQNTEQLMAKAREVMEALRNVPGLEGVDLGVQEATPELQWRIDRAKAEQLGVSFTDVADAIQTATSGDLSSYFLEGGFQYPIYVQVPESKRKSVPDLLNLPVQPSKAGANAKPVLLSQVAKLSYAYGPNEITRLDRQRYVAVTGRIQGRSESEVQADVGKAMSKVEFPQGTYWDYGQNQKRRGEEFSGLGMAVFLAIALIYMLLASQFESFIYPLVVLASVPLCIVGVVLALFISGRAFGLTAFIGLLMLIGIVVKNGILLVDYTNQLRGRGLGRDDAILTASPTRLRPILMTSSAAILGMLPLAIGIGKGSETQAPLATAVIGGLTTSTFLTLFVVPVVYTLFDDMACNFRKDPRDLAPASHVGPSGTAMEPLPTEADRGR